MSDAGITAYDSGRVDPPHDHAHHSPHLAHHFDSMEQQYDSGKLGMWVFLATELLMFGGLFCAYSVYRSNNPDVFLYAHSYLNTTWGAINTAVLLASSLTMAWAVRCSQLNQTRGLVILLLVTLLGGLGFMLIKGVEYNHKFHDDLAPGYYNKYNVAYKPTGGKADDGENNPAGVKRAQDELAKQTPKAEPFIPAASTPAKPYLYEDPNAAGPDKALIEPRYTGNTGLSESHAQVYGVPAVFQGHEETSHNTGQREGEHVSGTHEPAPEHHSLAFVDMSSKLAQQRVNTFFGVYYCMTGLHGIHVLVGMALITWITWRAADTKVKAWIPPLPILMAGVYFVFLYAISHWNPWWITSIPFLVIGTVWLVIRVTQAGKVAPAEVQAGEFSAAYFVPVDLVGLYWHLVDLIWIFLFPLLYLIHGKIGS